MCRYLGKYVSLVLAEEDAVAVVVEEVVVELSTVGEVELLCLTGGIRKWR